MTSWLVSLLAAGAVFLAVLGARSLYQSRIQVGRRLGEIRDGRTARSEEAVPRLTDRPLPALLQAVAFLGWVLPHLMASETLEWDLTQAGYRRREARGLFAGSKVLAALLLGVVALVVGSSLHWRQSQVVVLGLVWALLGFFVPDLWVTNRRAHRREAIMLALPDALDLMVICVEAGQGLNAAILKVGREISLYAPILSEELQLVNDEIRIGLSRMQALRNFAARSGVEEARALAAVLIQSDRLGTSIAKALRVHAQSLRTRRRQRAEETARKTAVKLVFPLVLCIFPELLIVILAPAMIQLIRVLSESA